MPQSIRSLVDRQVTRWYQERDPLKERIRQPGTPRPVTTISRHLGSGGAEIAKRLAIRMECELIGWSIVDAIVNQSDVRKDLVDKMDEKTRSRMEMWIETIREGKSFDEGDYHHYLLQTIRSFMELGSVVMLGRGACYVPTDRPRVSVRIIAPMEARIRRVMERDHSGRADALTMIKHSDEERTKFVERLFGLQWQESLNYDMIINTGRVSTLTAVSIIESAWIRYVTNGEYNG